MFTHVMLGAEDIDASRRFYDAVLGALGTPPGAADPKGRVVWISKRGLFMISRPLNGEPASCANGGTVGFAADSPEAVRAFHDAGLAAGGVTCEDPPGERQAPFGPLYLAYLRDPAGNKICAVHRVATPA